MDAFKNGGPAFPQPCTENGYAANTPYQIAGGGMDMRDYFAAHALAGMCSRSDILFGHLASYAYQLADAMLAEREKGGA